MPSVDITLGSEHLTLDPTLGAARLINASCKGMTNAVDGLRSFDLSVYALIIAAGIGSTKGKDIADLEQKIFTAGMGDLIAPLLRFVAMLMNGGRDPEETKDKAEANSGNG